MKSTTFLFVFVLVSLIIITITMTTAFTSAMPIKNHHHHSPSSAQKTGHVSKKVVAFRNTSRFSYVHMTMIEIINSTFYVMAFQADDIGEGSVTQNIYMCRSYDAGSSWSDPEVVVTTGGKFPVWGPCFKYVKTMNKLFLYFSRSVPQNIRFDRKYPSHYPGGDLCFITSTDSANGFKTWSSSSSPATVILPYLNWNRNNSSNNGTNGNFYGNVSKMTANTGPFLSAAATRSWAIPFWCEPHNPPNVNDTAPQQAGLIVTTDGGLTHRAVDHSSWQNSPFKSWLIENWVVPATSELFPDDSPSAVGALPLQQGFRTELGFMLTANAFTGFEDQANAFSKVRYTNIENPDSKTSAVALLDKRTNSKILGYALACNNDFSGRNLLSLYSGSLVNGDVVMFSSSSSFLVLENSTEYQSDYPTVIQGTEGEDEVFVSYSCFSHTGACFTVVKNVFLLRND